MKPAVFIVTTARGGIIDQDALAGSRLGREAHRWCGARRVWRGARRRRRCCRPTRPYDLDNVILTPHIGWQRLESRQRVVDMCASNVEAFASGEPGNIDHGDGRAEGAGVSAEFIWSNNTQKTAQRQLAGLK